MSQTTLHTGIAHAIRDHDLCRPGDCLIVAVSGGADSVALLDLLATLPHYSLRLIVAHLNHLLRGAESDADEQFVRGLASRYSLPCEVRRVHVRSLAQKSRLSLEEAGRQVRYAFFEELRQHYGATAVAVAHHADDQAETFLLRLLRGSGTDGLAAMSPRSGRAIIRPLLGLRRDELRTHLAVQGLTFREDSSNQDHSFLRNRVRLELLPLLATYNPAISARLAATADLLGEDEQLLVQNAHATWLQLATEGDGWAALPKELVQQQPMAMRMRLYRTALTAVSGDLRRIERKHCLALDELLQTGQNGKRIALPKGLTALLVNDHLLFAHRERLHLQPPKAITITGPGRYDLENGLQLLVEQAVAPTTWNDLPPHVSYFDEQTAPFPWELRPVRGNDRLEPLGMNGSRLARDILIDTKLPRHLRPCLPLLLYKGTPLWLPPLRRCRLALLPAEQPTGIRLTLLGYERLPLFPLRHISV